MTILIKNCRYLTPAYTIEQGSILLSGGIIQAIGKVEAKADRIIDGKNLLAMPPFYDCHTHSAMTLLRGAAEDLPLLDWLHKAVFPYEAKMTEEDVYWGTMLAISEYVRNGIAAAADMYFFADSVKKAATRSGFTVTCVGSVSDIASNNAEKQLSELKDMYIKSNAAKDPGFSVKLGYHAEYTASDKLLKGLAELADELKQPVFGHVSESAQENAECMGRSGKSPLWRAHSLGVFKHGGGAYHFVHPMDGDIELMKASGIHVITNPASNLKLSSGVAPVADYIEHGINIALGTDGAASNNALDMFREMYLLSVLQKTKTGSAQAMPVSKALEIATCSGAKLMFDRSGTLVAGGEADVLLLDLNAPNLQPVGNIARNILYSAGAQNVAITIVGGKILYENGRYDIGEDIGRIYSKCEQANRRIISSIK